MENRVENASGMVVVERRKKAYENAFWILLIIVISIATNWSERFRGVYLDDYGLWMSMKNDGFAAFALNLGANKIRPVAYAVMYIFGKLAEPYPEIMGFEVLLLHGLLAVMVFLMSKKMTQNSLVAFALSMAYQASRFAYYNATQYLGIMEDLGMLFTTLMLYSLYSGLLEKNMRPWATSLWYVLAMFSHERYMLLFPVLLYAAFFVKDRKQKKQMIVQSVLLFAGMVVLRAILFGNRLFDGTGGTDIKQTFSLMQAFAFAVNQVAYLFGWNAGEKYLNGYTQEEYSQNLVVFTIIMDICVLCVLIVAIVILCFSKEKEVRKEFFQISGLFLIYIAMNIGSSSTTIRLELRWIYVSFLAMLLFLAYLYSLISSLASSKKCITQLLSVVVCAYAALSCFNDAIIRKEWEWIYFYYDKNSADSLWDETYRKYGEKLWEKEILIVGNVENEERQVREWLLAYPDGENAMEMKIQAVENISDVPAVSTEKSLILLHGNSRFYRDITEFQSLIGESLGS